MVLPMTIVAYSDPSYGLFYIEGIYMLQLNPTDYSLSNNNTMSDRKAKTETTVLANGLELTKVKPPGPETIDIKFRIDATGAVPGFRSVKADIAKFKDLFFDVNPSTHTNNWCWLVWGDLSFECKLDSLTVDNTLFNALGVPIRAEVTAKFIEHIDPGQALSNYNSPDMSHMIEVKSGDNLPTMCKNIYGDASFYLQVAEINELTDFRNLTPGTKILFPRLEK
jgi:hypothetical protein